MEIGENMRFKRFYIEITNTCNLACSFCIQNARKPHQMNIEEFQHVIQEVKSYTKHVYFHVLGEPLSHPLLKEFFEICKKAELEVIITTNGTLLKKKLEDLCHAGCLRQINISLHSFPEHQQEQYLETIFIAAKELAKENIHVNYRLWSLKSGKLTKESEELLHCVLHHYGKDVQDIELKRMCRFDLDHYIHLHFEDIFTWPSLQEPYINDKGTCLGMKSMCAVLSDGSVVPCCLDTKADITLGNIFETPLKEIIESKRCKDMVKNFQNRCIQEELCKHCSYRLRFK